MNRDVDLVLVKIRTSEERITQVRCPKMLPHRIKSINGEIPKVQKKGSTIITDDFNLHID